MYERFYQLRERPFALSPDPDYLFPSVGHQEALGYLRYALEGHAGFVVITGEIGSGKTTLLQAVLRGIDRDTTVARLMNTLLDPRELIEAILIDLGLPTSPSKPAMLRELAHFLVSERQAGRLVLLVIDEAQNLSPAALEEVRMLSNLETEKSKLLQIVLVGQPDLRGTLDQPALEQLRQRITVSYHLGPLSAAETAGYINHRLRRAAGGDVIEFPRPVCDLIHRRSRGVPRMINVIADAILLFGYGAEQRQIDERLALDAVQELQATGVLPEAEPGEPEPEARPEPAAPPREVASWTTPAIMAVEPARSRESQAAAAAVAAAEESARELELRAREQVLARREAALAEQRRVLAEQYRLLNPTPAPAVVASPEPERSVPAWPPQAASVRQASFEPPARAPRSTAGGGGTGAGWWRRIRRALGAPEPLHERS